jgi:hypothetical protein
MSKAVNMHRKLVLYKVFADIDDAAVMTQYLENTQNKQNRRQKRTSKIVSTRLSNGL